MALLLMEGFDAYGSTTPIENNATLPEQYFGADITTLMESSQYVAAQMISSCALSRSGFGASAGHVAESGGFPDSSMFRRAFTTSGSLILGFAVYYTPVSFGSLLDLLYDNLLGTVSTQLSICVNDTAGISVVNGDNNLVAATAPNIIFPNSWNYIEFSLTGGMTAGTLTLKLNGATVLTVSAGQTQKTGAASTYNIVQSAWNTYSDNLSGGGFTCRKFIDDMYVCDTTGSAPFNTFLGDVVVHTVYPDADASPNAMTQVGGSAGHFTAVDFEPGSDGDTAYLTTNTSAVEELYNVGTLPSDIIEVLAVCIHVRARKDGPGSASFNTIGVLTSNTSTSPAQFMPTVYQTLPYILELEPGGGSWTKADAQNLKIGFISD